MKKWQYFLLVSAISLIMLVFQASSVSDVIRIGAVKPDFLLIILVYISFKEGSYRGELFGFFSGIAEDALSGGLFGLNALSKAITGYFVGKLKGKIFKQSIMLTTIMVFVSSIIKGLSFLLIMIIFVKNSNFSGRLSSIILPEAFYNAIFSPFLFFIFEKIEGISIDKLHLGKK